MATRTPKTDMTMGHRHRYAIDANGNGRTSTECHPENPTICHSHQIINFVVQHEKSNCYPNCTGIGAPGLGMHGHNFRLPEGINPPVKDGKRGIYNRIGPQGNVRTRVVNARRSAGSGIAPGENTTPGGPGNDQGTDGGGGSY